MKVSSSMISTSVAISAASSRPDSSTSERSVGDVDIENLRGVLLGEAFQRDQQERLARQGREAGEPLSAGMSAVDGRLLAVERDRIPDLGEQPIERDPRAAGLVDDRRIRDQGLQGGAHIGVAGGLAAGQGPGITPQKRQVLRYGL